jgi:hypothetical protein
VGASRNGWEEPLPPNEAVGVREIEDTLMVSSYPPERRAEFLLAMQEDKDPKLAFHLFHSMERSP